jgi:outer membrane lipoprotein carrier protein
MKNLRAIVLILCCLLSTTLARQKEVSAREITERLQRRYDTMQDASVKFSQVVRFGFSKLEQSSAGTFLMKRPNKYRIELGHQTIVTNGSVVWSYAPANKQVLIDRYKENLNSLSPDQFLLNLPSRYSATLLGKEPLGRGQTYTLKLIPKDDQSFVKSIKVWVEDSSWVVRRVQIVDVNDTETLYTIHEIKLNTQVSDALFSFTPPPGTEVVDLR